MISHKFTNYFGLAFFLLVIFSFSKKYDDVPKLYKIALTEHISKIEKNIATLSDKKQFHKNPICVINNNEVSLPYEIDGHKIQELKDSTGYFDINGYKKYAIKLNPLSIERNDIIITLSDYIVSKSASELKFVYVGGVKYVFNYDFENKKYKIIRMTSINF